MFKSILILSFVLCLTYSQTICPSTLLNKCQTEVQKVFQVCEKAAQQKGKDQSADIQCMQYFLSAQKDCWPCICQIAKNQGYKINGCDKLIHTIEMLKDLRSQWEN